MPVLAECGGFIYLHDIFEDEKGVFRQGVGQIKGKVFNTGKLSRFGYIEASCKKPVFGRQLGMCPAHEFHYFDSTSCGADFYAKNPCCNPEMLLAIPDFRNNKNEEIPPS